MKIDDIPKRNLLNTAPGRVRTPAGGPGSGVRRFFQKLLLMGVLLFLTGFIPFYLPVSFESPMATMIDKWRLLESSAPPRVIFVGGSGLFCGLDCSVVGARLEMKPVNMAFYAGFGILPYLDVFPRYLREGDVVVLVPEYGVLNRGLGATDDVRPWLLAIDPRNALRTLYPRNREGMRMFLKDELQLIRSKIESLTSLGFSFSRRPGFRKVAKEMDPFGDLIPSRQFKRVPEEKLEGRGGLFPMDPPLGEAIAALNAFARTVEERGVKIFFAWPGYPESDIRLNEDRLRALQDTLEAELRFPILGVPEDFSYPYRRFTNTIDHLDEEGKRLRTEKLVSLLQENLKGTTRGRS